MNTNELIDDYWNETLELNSQYHGDDFGVCQCGTEKLIQGSKNQLKTRAFLLFGVLFDQIIHSNFGYIHRHFEEKFKFPKLYSHGLAGYSSPEWFIYSHRGYNKEIDWDYVKIIGNVITKDITKWLVNNKFIQEPLEFKNIMLREVNRYFKQKEEIEKINEIVNSSFV